MGARGPQESSSNHGKSSMSVWPILNLLIKVSFFLKERLLGQWGIVVLFRLVWFYQDRN